MKSFYKTLLLLIINFQLSIINSFSQQAPGIEWQNTIGGSGNDYFFSLQQTNDVGYILGGRSNSNISGDKTENTNGFDDYWIVKTDSIGNIQWQNSIGGSGGDQLSSISQTADNGFIVGGYSFSHISGDKSENCFGGSDYWIIKCDSGGTVQWDNTIGGSGNDWFDFIEQTSDGGYILGGTSSSDSSGDKTENSNGSYDYWILKTDASGNIMWQNTIGGSLDDYLRSIRQTSDGGYILGGSSRSNISGDKTENSNGGADYWIVKTDSIGIIQWQNTIGGNDDDGFEAIQQTMDGGYLLGGNSLSNISGDKTENCQGGFDYWIVKTDALGNVQWQNTIGGGDNDYLYSMQQTSDGGFIIGGTSLSNISGDKAENCIGKYDYWILKTNIFGNILWQNTIGGDTIDILRDIHGTFDGGYILGGESLSNISGDKTENCQGDYDYWIIKLLPDTITSIPQLPQLSNYPITISPNPSSGIFQITFPSSANQKVNYTLDVINTLGQTVFKSQLSTLNSHLSTDIDLSFLPKGIYVLKINDGINASGKKLIIQ